jgi:hypothetical protein
MKIFDNQRMKLYFLRFKTKKDKDGRKFVSMDFAIPFHSSPANQEKLGLLTPPFVATTISAVYQQGAKISNATIDGTISGQNVAFYPLPEAGEQLFSVKNVELSALAVSRDEGLLFTIEAPIGLQNVTGHAAVDHFGTMLFAEFKEAQPALNLKIEEKAV